ncbi:MAG: hypothetical protein ACRD2P_00080, partial [Terriglobia bacterium]
LCVSKSSNSDSNNGASKAAPWAHLLLLLMMFVPWQTVLGACHVVTPNGSGSQTGADWNNALANLPGTLTRGDVYYLADGNYGSYTFNTAASGTATIEIRKAQTYDHCTDTGWNASTMGSSQAVFSGATFNNLFTTDAPYFILNGNGTSTGAGCGNAPGTTVTSNPPAPSDCGFKFDNSADTAGTTLYNEVSAPAHVTYEYLEISEPGDNTNEQYDVFGPGTGPSTYIHVYGHNAGCVYFQDGGDTRTISHSYFWGTETNGAGGGCHGQFSFEDGATSNSSEYNNVYRDITGTAIWTFANTSTTHNNWSYYDNVIWDTFPAASWSPFLSDGVIACINAGTNCTNFVFVQNDIINLPLTSASGINNENTGSYTVENNIWYNCGLEPGFNIGTGGTYTHQYNSYLQTVGGPSGAAAVLVTSFIPNPFVSWTTGNFNLASDNSDWDNRLALGPPYTTDVNGVIFSTDRGAYQLGQSSVQPPTNLQAAPH